MTRGRIKAGIYKPSWRILAKVGEKCWKYQKKKEDRTIKEEEKQDKD